MKNIVIQGLGFVGSAMAVAISSQLDKKNKPLFNVVGVEVDNKIGQEKVTNLNSGIFPYKSNDIKLENEFKKAIKRGNFKATLNKNEYSKADIIIVSINCDLITENGKKVIALSQFSDSINEIGEKISEETLIIIESTVPPGTCDKIIYPIFKKHFLKRNLDINKLYLAHSYERVMPGSQYYDSIINFWRVYAGINKVSADLCEKFLSKILNISEFPLTRLNKIIASETGKLLENSYRAVNIAFIDEWSRFAEDNQFDLFEVIDAIRMRPTHSNIRQPGFGVGGYCLTKDPLFAKIAARDILGNKNHEFPFSTQAIKINNSMPLVTLNKIKKYFNGNIKDKKVLLMGVSYRQDIADTRYSPSELFYRRVFSEGAIIDVHDPIVDYWEELEINIPKKNLDFINYDIVVFAVNHKDYREIQFSNCVPKNKTLIFDANNVLTTEQLNQLKQKNWQTMSIGRGI